MPDIDNKGRVFAFYQALATQSESAPLAMADYFTAEAEWHLPRSSPMHGTLKGLDAIAGLFAGAVDEYYQPGSLQYDYRTVIADADHVMMQFTLKAVTANGKDYENDYCLLYRLENGLIAEVREFFDTATLFAIQPPPDA
ncbi:nuclear transport factor 2 family protein [Halioglobus maricola]|nr:nuclear transport factor 2 family protein [Halioglobus maricola]